MWVFSTWYKKTWYNKTWTVVNRCKRIYSKCFVPNQPKRLSTTNSVSKQCVSNKFVDIQWTGGSSVSWHQTLINWFTCLWNDLLTDWLCRYPSIGVVVEGFRNSFHDRLNNHPGSNYESPYRCQWPAWYSGMLFLVYRILHKPKLPGARFTNDFLPQFKFDGSFALL